MRVGKIKFSVVAGLLVRGQIRRALNKMVADIRFQSPGSKCYLDEDKSLLESEFTFVGQDLPENIIEGIKDWQKKVEKLAA